MYVQAITGSNSHDKVYYTLCKPLILLNIYFTWFNTAIILARLYLPDGSCEHDYKSKLFSRFLNFLSHDLLNLKVTLTL